MQIEQVTVGSLAEDNSEMHDGFVYISKTDTLVLAVSGMDPESGLQKYSISIGTSKGNSNNQSLTSNGS